MGRPRPGKHAAARRALGSALVSAPALLSGEVLLLRCMRDDCQHPAASAAALLPFFSLQHPGLLRHAAGCCPLPLIMLPPHVHPQSFKFVVEAWGHSYSMAEQVALIESMEPCCQFEVRRHIAFYPRWFLPCCVGQRLARIHRMEPCCQFEFGPGCLAFYVLLSSIFMHWQEGGQRGFQGVGAPAAAGPTPCEPVGCRTAGPRWPVPAPPALPPSDLRIPDTQGHPITPTLGRAVPCFSPLFGCRAPSTCGILTTASGSSSCAMKCARCRCCPTGAAAALRMLQSWLAAGVRLQ